VAGFSSEELKHTIMKKIRDKYELGTERKLTKNMGCEVDYDLKKGRLTVKMENYIRNMAKQFDLAEAKFVDTPCAIQKLKPVDSEEELLNDKEAKLYASMVGSLMYLMITCRPDIAFAVNQLSRFVLKPSEEHRRAAQRCIAYCLRTATLGLMFTKESGESEITCYVDSDFMGALNSNGDLRSVGGYILYHKGNVIAWKAATQKTPSLSTTESELIAGTLGAQECMYISNLIKELEGRDANPTYLVKGDNQAMLKICSSERYVGRVKHLDVRYHFLRFQATKGKCTLEYVDTKENVADILTKPLPRETHLRHIGRLVW
jgi:hypothetical protein